MKIHARLNRLSFAFVVASTCAFVGCQTAKATAPSKGEGTWQPVFDGQSLAGWQVQMEKLPLGQDPDRIFSVHDGVIHAYRDTPTTATVSSGFLLSEKEYGDFVLSFEFRWGEKKFAPRADRPRDAGLLFHVHGESKVWPRSIELQVQEGDVGDIFTVGTVVETTIAPASVVKGEIPAATYLPAEEGGVAHAQGDRGITRIAKYKNAERPGWNTVELQASGDEAVYRVNGVVVNRFRVLRTVEDDGNHRVLSRGKLALQAEGAEVMYRNVRIRSL